MLQKGYVKNPKQCRERWINYINPSLEKAPLTNSEIDKLFILYHKYGSSWTKMSSIFKNRSENILKNTFYREIKRLAKKMKKEIVKVSKQSIFYLEFTVNLSVLTKVGRIMNIPLNQIPSKNTSEFIQVLISLNNKRPRASKLLGNKEAPEIPFISDSSTEDNHSNVQINSSNEINELSSQLMKEINTIEKEGKDVFQPQRNLDLSYEEELKQEEQKNITFEDFNLDNQEFNYCNFSLWNENSVTLSMPTFEAIFGNDLLNS